MNDNLLYIIQYAEISLIGVGILFIILYSMWKQKTKKISKSNKLLIGIIVANMTVLLSDTIILLFRNHPSTLNIILNNISCMFYFLAQQSFSLLWLLYVVKRIHPNKKISNVKKIITILPSIVAMILILSSPFTNIVYSINSNNRYSRGNGMYILLILNYIYYFAAAVTIIRNMRINKKMKEESPYGSLLLFSIPTLLVSIIQVSLYGITLTWIFSALSLMLLYINIQFETIYKDKLTNLFNRDYINKQIEWLIENNNNNDKPFVVMSDLDYFKSINDTYGHLVGDKALINIAELLKKSCSNKMEVARFVGDEFLITGTIKEEKELIDLINVIQKNINKFNEVSNEKYKLSISMGYSIYDKEKVPSSDDLILLADKNMYKEKEQKKAKR